MARLTTPRYFKIESIQSILTYIFTGSKRPSFIQLKNKPDAVALVRVTGSISTARYCKAVVQITEKMEMEKLIMNLLKSIEIDQNLFCNKINNKENIKSLYDKNINNSKDRIDNSKDRTDDFDINSNSSNANIDNSLNPNIDNFSKLNIDNSLNPNIETNTPIYGILKYISEENLSLIEKQDILHLFSYSSFIRDKIKFNPNVFNSYIKPNRVCNNFIVAIDCEMMDTIDGRQVGRISILNKNGMTIYDKYVQPRSQVTDFLEKYSGLNYKNTSTGITFQQMQKDILEIIGINTYILGHGLENDLSALELYTPNVIDTAYLFIGTGGTKMKLKQLSKKYFNLDIQKGSHNSNEDALCCLKLLAYKILQILKINSEDTPLIDFGAKITKVVNNSTEKCDLCKKHTDKAVCTSKITSESIKELLCCSQKAIYILNTCNADNLDSAIFCTGIYPIYFYEENDDKFICFKQSG